MDLAVERGYSPIKFTAALPAPHGTLYEDAAPTFESPGLERVAATAMYGDDFKRRVHRTALVGRTSRANDPPVSRGRSTFSATAREIPGLSSYNSHSKSAHNRRSMSATSLQPAGPTSA